MLAAKMQTPPRDRKVIAEPASGEPPLHADGDRLVLDHLGLARALARRFSNRGEPLDDLEQTACLALVKAARHYDSQRGVPFSAYTTVSILGELKRHFRDHSWGIRVPRGVQERYLSLKDAQADLTHKHAQAPSIAEIAGHLGIGEEDVLEAMEAGKTFWATSLAQVSSYEDSPPGEQLPDSCTAYDDLVDRAVLEQVLPSLDHRDKTILKRYFFDNWTQRDIGDELGVSQMQVSRHLARILVQLRTSLI